MKKLRDVVIYVLLLMVILTCTSCEFASRDTLPAGETETEEIKIETEESEEEVILPDTKLTMESLDEWLTKLVCGMEESAETEFLTTGLSEDEVRELIEECLHRPGDEQNMYLKYYMALAEYEMDYRTVLSDSYIVLKVTPEYFDDCVPFEEIRHVYNQGEVYEAFVDGFKTGFERVVMCIHNKTLEPEPLISMVEEASWNIGTKLPILYKNITHYTYYDPVENAYIMSVKLGYDAYGITLEDQLEAQSLVQQQVLLIANEIKEITDDPRQQCIELYREINSRVDFDYDLGIALDDVLTSNDPEIGIGRGIYGALINGKSVCSGYASAYKAVCDELKIPCMVLIGYAEESDHAWNMVILDGKVEYIDTTWGDSNKWYSTYLFITAEQMEYEDRRIYESIYIPQMYIDAGYIRKDAFRKP